MSQPPSSPYTEPTSVPPPADSGLKTLLIVLSVIGVVGLVMCGGIVGLGYYGYLQVKEQLANLDLDSDVGYENALGFQVAADPKVIAEVGEIESVTEDWERTMEETALTDDFYWYRVEGSKGTRFVKAEQSTDIGEGGEWFETAFLEQSDGTLVELQLQPAPFDSIYGEWLYTGLESNDVITQYVGELQSVAQDPLRTADETDLWTHWLIVRGSEGEASVKAVESEYEDVFTHAEVVLEDGSRAQLW